jgi:hypothetical protein
MRLKGEGVRMIEISNIRNFLIQSILVLMLFGGTFILFQYPSNELLKTISFISIGFSAGILFTLLLVGAFNSSKRN